MKNRYEGLLVLSVKGTEDSAKEIIERLEKDFTKEGAKVEQVLHLDEWFERRWRQRTGNQPRISSR